MLKKQKHPQNILKIPKEQVANFYKHQLYDLKVQENSSEWDSLIVIPNYKLIINIEVKSGKSWEVLKSASNQTKKHHNFLNKVFGCVLSEDWKFLRSVCMPHYKFEGDTTPCNNCRKYLLGTTEMLDIENWIKCIVADDINHIDNSCQDDYENLIVRLIGFTSIQKSFEINKLLVNPIDFRKRAEEKLAGEDSGLSGEGGFKNRHELKKKLNEEKMSKVTISSAEKYNFNCYMLTLQQLNALKYSSQMLILLGDYGSGKTFVLKERAKLHATKYPDEKIVYINLTNLNLYMNEIENRFSVMDFYAKIDFQDFSNIDVITSENLTHYYQKNEEDIPTSMTTKTLYATIKHFLDNSDYNTIFIDELRFDEEWLSEKSSGCLPTDKTVCATMMVDNNPGNFTFSFDLTLFFLHKMGYNLIIC